MPGKRGGQATAGGRVEGGGLTLGCRTLTTPHITGLAPHSVHASWRRCASSRPFCDPMGQTPKQRLWGLALPLPGCNPEVTESARSLLLMVLHHCFPSLSPWHGSTGWGPYSSTATTNTNPKTWERKKAEQSPLTDWRPEEPGPPEPAPRTPGLPWTQPPAHGPEGCLGHMLLNVLWK